MTRGSLTTASAKEMKAQDKKRFLSFPKRERKANYRKCAALNSMGGFQIKTAALRVYCRNWKMGTSDKQKILHRKLLFSCCCCREDKWKVQKKRRRTTRSHGALTPQRLHGVRHLGGSCIVWEEWWGWSSQVWGGVSCREKSKHKVLLQRNRNTQKPWAPLTTVHRDKDGI